MSTPVIDLNAVAYDRLPETGDGDRQGMVMYLQAEVFKKAANQNFAKFLHRIARRFNDPNNPEVAASRFKAHCEDLCRYACSPSIPSELRQDEKKFKLDNNSGFAQAYKKLFAAMNLGGDLKSEDLDTVSKCGRWANEKKAEIEEAERRKKIEQYLKDNNIDLNSEEAQKLLGIPGEKVEDPISLKLKEVEELLRKHVEVAPEGQTLEMLENFVEKVQHSLEKVIAYSNEQAARAAMAAS